LSVTTKLNTALVLNDFDDSEVVLQLRCGRDCNLRYFDCSWLSDYPLESEHIICGGLGTALIANVYDLCAGLRFDHHLLAINLFVAAISAKPLPNVHPDAAGQVALALSSMMKAHLSQQAADDPDADSKEDDDEGNSFIDDTFSAICSVTHYAQIHLVEIKTSDILTGALYKEEDAVIRLDTLRRMLPNCSRFHVSLRGVDKEEAARILFSEKLIKFLTKTSGDAPSKLRGITFEVDPEIKVDAKHFAQSGWTVTCAMVDDLQFVKLQRG